jgi:ureidoglycolate dehydrogenase (NAD+)
MNGLTLAIDITRFCNPDTFAAQIKELVATLKLLPKAEGVDEILMPGERGYRLADTRMQEGIPLAAGTVERLTELAKRYDIPVPSTF